MTAIKSRMVLSVTVAFGAVALMILGQAARATHPRPLSASPMRVSLVPAYEECTSPNRTHGPPLDSPSCNPPVQSSRYLTIGTFDANGADARSEGFVKVAVRVGVPGPPNDSEVIITGRVTDVRCKMGTSACGNVNSAGGADYTGELQGNATIRITDHFNSVDPGGGTDPATVVDVPFPINMSCGSTADTSIGGVCDINQYCPLPQSCGPRDGDRTVVGITQLQVFDGGPDGVVATEDNTLFMNQGVFIP
jgi:hypothetical protein